MRTVAYETGGNRHDHTPYPGRVHPWPVAALDQLAAVGGAVREVRPRDLHAGVARRTGHRRGGPPAPGDPGRQGPRRRSEEHTSELQSRVDIVCRLLLE